MSARGCVLARDRYRLRGRLGRVWKPFKKVGIPLRQGLDWGYQEDTQVSFSYEPDGQDRRTETWKIHNRLLLGTQPYFAEGMAASIRVSVEKEVVGETKRELERLAAQ